MTAGRLMLPVIALAAVIGLRPHRHAAVSAPDDTLEQILPCGLSLQGLGPAAVLLQVSLNSFEDIFRNQCCMQSRNQFPLMGDLAHIERIMQDSPDRSGSKDPGSRDEVTIGIRQPVHIAGPQALAIQPGG